MLYYTILEEGSAYYDEVTLSQQFTWMQLFLERTDTIEKEEKQAIQKDLHMFEQLWNESPRVQKMREDFRHEFLQEGEIKAFQRMLVNIVRARFPELAGDAQARAQHLKTPEAFDVLIQKLVTASDVNAARVLLTRE